MAKAWPVPGLRPEDTFRAAAGKVIATRSAEVLAYQRAVLTQGSVDDVHDLRVSIRRLRANFDAFRDVFERPAYEARRARLRDLASKLGEVRDADVMAGMLADRLEKAGSEPLRAALRVLRSEALGEAESGRDERLEASAGDALGGAIADLVQFAGEVTSVTPARLGLPWPDPPPAPVPPEPVPHRDRKVRVDPDAEVGTGLWELLTWRLRRVRRADDAAVAAAPDDSEELHNLRIAIKRLRYIGEVGALVLPDGGADDLLDALSDLQDELGDVHDADVLTGLAEDHRAAGGSAPAAGWTELTELVAADRAASREKALGMLEDLRPDKWEAVQTPFRALKG
jgi:CHAD domain-containing protein